MGVAKFLDEKTHVENVTDPPTLGSLDTIEQTKTGKFSWLMSITAGKQHKTR
jgi:MFS transporter, SP family, solute carrier family 2 (myo-inositol transporter), member 13